MTVGAEAAGKARGRFGRNGVPIFRIRRLLPGDQTAIARHVARGWFAGIRCGHRGFASLQIRTNDKSTPCRCRAKERAKRLRICDLAIGNASDSGERS